MRDDLLGFALGALDASEHEQIQRRLEQDAKLRQQLEAVQRGLRPLRVAREPVTPPAGLAARTCQLIGDIAGPPSGGAPAVTPLRRSTARGLSPAPAEWSGDARMWSVADFIVAAGVCLAAACMFFPAIVASRYQSQRVLCQQNLRQAGVALVSYSELTDGRFPTVPAKGNAAVAGIYAPKLIDQQLADPQVFECPAAKNRILVVRVPYSLRDVYQARGPQLWQIQQSVGGDYAYRFPYLVNGRLQAQRNRGRENFALLADVPLELNGNSCISSHGPGQNLLFEDGHVSYLATRRLPGALQDDLFLNHQGLVEAGLEEQDCVLAPSHATPLPRVRSDDVPADDLP